MATALDTSYLASQLALFGIVVGVALLLSGFGFAILAIGGALRNPESPLTVVFGNACRKLQCRLRLRWRNALHSAKGLPVGWPSRHRSMEQV